MANQEKPRMAEKFSLLISVAAFLVAWLTGLAAGVSTGTILMRSLIGAAAFFAASLAVRRVWYAALDFPAADSDEQAGSDDGRGAAIGNETT